MLSSLVFVLQEAATEMPEEVIPTDRIIFTVLIALAAISVAAVALRLLVERRWQESGSETPDRTVNTTNLGRRTSDRPPLRLPQVQSGEHERPPRFDPATSASLLPTVSAVDSTLRAVGGQAAEQDHGAGFDQLLQFENESSRIEVPMFAAGGASRTLPGIERRNGHFESVALGRILNWQEKSDRVGFQPDSSGQRRSRAETPARIGSRTTEHTGSGEFVPWTGHSRQTGRKLLPIGQPGSEVDPDTAAVVTQLVRDLMYCANNGELLLGFTLYSESFLFRFMDSTGCTEIEFRAMYGVRPPRQRIAWERLDQMTEMHWQANGIIEATASYISFAGQPARTRERYRFAYDNDQATWRIDDIVQLPPAED
jgi:hypothetical protein